MSRLARGVALTRTVAREARARDLSLLSASIAYYAVVSVVPLLVLTAAVATAVGGPSLRRAVLDLAGRSLLPVGRAPVEAALTTVTGRGVTPFGLPVLVWGSLRLFRGVEAAFASVYGTPARGTLATLRAGATVLVAVGVGVLGALTLVGVLALVALPLPVVGVLGPLTFFGVLLATLLPVYALTPAVDASVRDALPGAALAAAGWTLLGTAFALYARLAATGRLALYGVLGALVLLVTWFYLAGLVLLFGATLNAVLAGHLRTLAPTASGPDRQVQHPAGRDHATTEMTDDDTAGDGTDPTDNGTDPTGTPDIADLAERVDRLRSDLDDFEGEVAERTVDRPDLEADLKRYVRRRLRRGHARGWGPYLVLLYGTVMTVAAFYLLSDLLAVVAMVIIFLSTLGLYVLFVLAGVGLSLLDAPGRALDLVRRLR